jgi:hypothetical protein
MSYVQVSMPNGAIALVEIDPEAGPGGQISTGSVFDFKNVGPAIQGAADVVLDAVKRIAPTKATVELNIHFEVREGLITAAFVRGGSKHQ